MPKFRGSFIHVVDEKGRVNFPSKLKKHVSPEANDTFIITRGFETCLFVYPLDEWNKYESKLEGLNSHEEDNRFFTRELLEYVTECTLDKQSRLIITQDLRDHAGIKDQVLIIGQIERVEFWNPTTYAEYKRGRQVSYAEIAAKVLGTGNK